MSYQQSYTTHQLLKSYLMNIYLQLWILYSRSTKSVYITSYILRYIPHSLFLIDICWKKQRGCCTRYTERTYIQSIYFICSYKLLIQTSLISCKIYIWRSHLYLMYYCSIHKWNTQLRQMRYMCDGPSSEWRPDCSLSSVTNENVYFIE